ncbi:hypothetical protein LCGC14_2460000, partial [marine sediment metagenome]
MAMKRDEQEDINKPLRATAKELEEEEPLRPPNDPNKSRLDLGGGLGKTILVTAVVSFLVFTMIGFFGGGSFLTKQQFEDNLAGMVATLDQAKADVA